MVKVHLQILTWFLTKQPHPVRHSFLLKQKYRWQEMEVGHWGLPSQFSHFSLIQDNILVKFSQRKLGGNDLYSETFGFNSTLQWNTSMFLSSLLWTSELPSQTNSRLNKCELKHLACFAQKEIVSGLCYFGFL